MSPNDLAKRNGCTFLSVSHIFETGGRPSDCEGLSVVEGWTFAEREFMSPKDLAKLNGCAFLAVSHIFAAGGRPREGLSVVEGWIFGECEVMSPNDLAKRNGSIAEDGVEAPSLVKYKQNQLQHQMQNKTVTAVSRSAVSVDHVLIPVAGGPSKHNRSRGARSFAVQLRVPAEGVLKWCTRSRCLGCGGNLLGEYPQAYSRSFPAKRLRHSVQGAVCMVYRPRYY
ncbi:hypothetical protein BaRGS_00003275 [Batillaria attramentaria]|uniref:Uncharacterized protein n=1 Tax=Batillaria attramentaria TaxID=370345 RepID=A0ABD0M1V9_9CAEN